MSASRRLISGWRLNRPGHRRPALWACLPLLVLAVLLMPLASYASVPNLIQRIEVRAKPRFKIGRAHV